MLRSFVGTTFPVTATQPPLAALPRPLRIAARTDSAKLAQYVNPRVRGWRENNTNDE